MLPTMQGLVENAMYISQGGIPMYEGDVSYQWSCVWRLILICCMINQYKPHLTRRENSMYSY